MATPPVFTTGAVLTAAQMNAAGLWKINTLTISGATSGFIDNVFTSDFTNYKIIGNWTTTTAANLTLTYRGASGDITLSNYKSGTYFVSYPATAFTFGGSAGAANYAEFGRVNANGEIAYVSYEIGNPQASGITSIIGTAVDGLLVRTMGGIYNASTAITGFKLSCGTNITGTFDIYGITK